MLTKSDCLSILVKMEDAGINIKDNMKDLLISKDIPTKVLNYLGIIKKSSNHLMQLINNVLDMTRIESGKMLIKNDPFDITEDYSWCYGVKVKIVDLPQDKHIYYKKRGTFFKANSIANKVKELYDDN